MWKISSTKKSFLPLVFFKLQLNLLNNSASTAKSVQHFMTTIDFEQFWLWRLLSLRLGRSVTFGNRNKYFLFWLCSDRRRTFTPCYSWLPLKSNFLKSQNFPVFSHVFKLLIFPRISNPLRSCLEWYILLIFFVSGLVFSSQKNNRTRSSPWIMSFLYF